MKIILFLFLTGAALAMENSTSLSKVIDIMRANPSKEYRVDFVTEFAGVSITDSIKVKTNEVDKLKDKENAEGFQVWSGISTSKGYFYVKDAN